jgi:hypothetical protein
MQQARWAKIIDLLNKSLLPQKSYVQLFDFVSEVVGYISNNFVNILSFV